MSAVLSILLETQHQKILHLYFPVRKKGWKIFRQHLKEIQMQKKISVKILYCQHGIMFKHRIKLARWHCQEVQMWNARRQANTFWENKYFQKNPFFCIWEAVHLRRFFCVCEFDGACAYAHEQRQVHTSVPCDRSLSARRQFCGQTCYRMSTRRFSGYNCCPFSFSWCHRVAFNQNYKI